VGAEARHVCRRDRHTGLEVVVGPVRQVFDLDAWREHGFDGGKGFQCFRDDFGSDAVAGDDCETAPHGTAACVVSPEAVPNRPVSARGAVVSGGVGLWLTAAGCDSVYTYAASRVMSESSSIPA